MPDARVYTVCIRALSQSLRLIPRACVCGGSIAHSCESIARRHDDRRQPQLPRLGRGGNFFHTSMCARGTTARAAQVRSARLALHSLRASAEHSARAPSPPPRFTRSRRRAPGLFSAQRRSTIPCVPKDRWLRARPGMGGPSSATTAGAARSNFCERCPLAARALTAAKINSCPRRATHARAPPRVRGRDICSPERNSSSSLSPTSPPGVCLFTLDMGTLRQSLRLTPSTCVSCGANTLAYELLVRVDATNAGIPQSTSAPAPTPPTTATSSAHLCARPPAAGATRSESRRTRQACFISTLQAAMPAASRTPHLRDSALTAILCGVNGPVSACGTCARSFWCHGPNRPPGRCAGTLCLI